MAGYAAGLAHQSRIDRPTATQTPLQNASQTPLEEANAEFERLQRLDAELELEQRLVNPISTIDPDLLEDIVPERQEAFKNDYAEAYREGYAKGLQANAVERPSISEPDAKANFEAISKESANYVVEEPAQAALAAGLLDKDKDIELSIDKDTLDALSAASHVDAQEMQDAIAFYARADENTQKDLLTMIETAAPSVSSSKDENYNDPEIMEAFKKMQAMEDTISDDLPPPRRQSARISQNTKTTISSSVPKAQSNPQNELVASEPVVSQSVANLPALTSVGHSIAQVIDALHEIHRSSQAASQVPSAPEALNPPKAPETNPSTVIHFSPTVKGIFEHSINEDYRKEKPNSIISKIAQTLGPKKERKNQISVMDHIRTHLATNAPDISEQDKAIILHAVMKAMLEDLQKESRFTKIFGTQSRLETVLNKDIQAIKANFENADFSDTNAKGLIKAHISMDTNPDVRKECDAILGHTKLPNVTRPS